jgi:hypothetical protein
MQTDKDPVDSFQIWREDKERLPPFTTDVPWPDAPRLFRWEFAFRWRHIEHGVNPHTGRPDTLLSMHETRFFEGWELADYDKSKAKYLAKYLLFQQLAGCRVFAFPKIRYATAKEIDAMLKSIGDFLKADMVCKGDILGTETEWKVCLAVERNRADCQRNGQPFSLDAAIDEAGEMLYGRKYDVKHRREIVLGYFRAMEATGSDPGWIQKIFPRLPPDFFPKSQISAT